MTFLKFIKGLTFGFSRIVAPFCFHSVKENPRLMLLDTNVKRILSRTDAEAIRSDWEAVGFDLHTAIARYSKENNFR